MGESRRLALGLSTPRIDAPRGLLTAQAAGGASAGFWTAARRLGCEPPGSSREPTNSGVTNSGEDTSTSSEPLHCGSEVDVLPLVSLRLSQHAQGGVPERRQGR